MNNLQLGHVTFTSYDLTPMEKFKIDMSEKNINLQLRTQFVGEALQIPHEEEPSKENSSE